MLGFLEALPLRPRLLAVLTGAALMGLAGAGWIGYQSGRSSLTEAAYRELTQLRAAKASQLETYFDRLCAHLLTLSEDLTVIAAIREFRAARTGPALAAAGERYSAFFRGVNGGFGYLDILLIDADSGRPFFSVTQAPRGANLEASVGELREERDCTAALVSDFEETPRGPVAYIAAPVCEGERLLGALAIALPVQAVDQVVNAGSGGVGETYVVGADGLMRSNTGGNTALRRRVETAAASEARNGQSGTRMAADYRGRAALSSYAPLRIEGLDWSIVSEAPVDRALAPVAAFRRRLLWFSAALLAGMAAIALAVTGALLRPIRALMKGVRAVASGDLRARVETGSRDELAELAAAFNAMVDRVRESTGIIERKSRENERLLLSILPAPVAQRLKAGEEPIADNFDEATVLFADIVGFTQFAAARPAHELVALLNDLFSRFDAAAARHGVEKIKTIGDSYMAASGLPERRADHCEAMLAMALEMFGILEDFNRRNGLELGLRIGVHTGPAVAGVIGTAKFIYDLWGDTVNVASRMESHGVAGRVQATEAVFDRSRERFRWEARGEVEVKGRGAISTWLLDPRTASVVPWKSP